MSDISYTNWHSMSDSALIKLIGEFVQHHRLNQNKSQNDVANAANISRSTLSLLERGEKVTLNSLIQVLRVLNLLFVMEAFKINHQISPIEYAKLQKNKRSRARSKGVDSNDELEW